MVFAGIYPTDSDQYEGLRDALEKLVLNDASLHYEPESSTALGLRVPLRLPRPAAHGDRAGAAGARVQPRASSPPCPTVEYHVYRTDGEMLLLENPSNLPDPAGIDRDRRAVRQGAHHGARRVHRRHHEARPGAPRRLQRHALHRHHAGRVRLRVPAGRDRARLLRQAQVALARLRLARLRDGGLPRVGPGEARHAHQRRPDRRLQRHHPPRTRRRSTAARWRRS